jgi:uncharacterized zinc-type alcohol dehydrogenase-like protein
MMLVLAAAPKEHDVRISIKFCGICHSDLHQIKNEWGGSTFPVGTGYLVREGHA